MKIINRTRWQTAHLVAFIRRVAADELDGAKRKRLTIKIVPCRQQRYCTGNTNCYNRIKLRIPTLLMDDQIKIDFCTVIAHEMHHVETGSYGRSWEIHNRRSAVYGHGNLTPEQRERQRQIYAWALALPLEAKPKPIKIAIDPVQSVNSKRELMQSRITEWERRAKRAKTALRKYRTKLRYYDRRLAAMGSG